jgi:myo-inositol 2-dehydrogenase / D-chiro-inositol 1-dehydrogenase
LKVGLLGAGRIGLFHATELAEDHRVEEMVVGDVDAKRAAAALAERIGGSPTPSRRSSVRSWTL